MHANTFSSDLLETVTVTFHMQHFTNRRKQVLTPPTLNLTLISSLSKVKIFRYQPIRLGELNEYAGFASNDLYTNSLQSTR